MRMTALHSDVGHIICASMKSFVMLQKKIHSLRREVLLWFQQAASARIPSQPRRQSMVAETLRREEILNFLQADQAGLSWVWLLLKAVTLEITWHKDIMSPMYYSCISSIRIRNSCITEMHTVKRDMTESFKERFIELESGADIWLEE